MIGIIQYAQLLNNLREFYEMSTKGTYFMNKLVAR